MVKLGIIAIPILAILVVATCSGNAFAATFTGTDKSIISYAISWDGPTISSTPSVYSGAQVTWDNHFTNSDPWYQEYYPKVDYTYNGQNSFQRGSNKMTHGQSGDVQGVVTASYSGTNTISQIMHEYQVPDGGSSGLGYLTHTFHV